MKRVIVVGAGAAGLAAAVRLRHAGYDVALYEKEPQVGGKMSALLFDGCNYRPLLFSNPLFRGLFHF